MSRDVIAPPEPKEIDEKASMELRILSSNAGLKGRPSGDYCCDTAATTSSPRPTSPTAGTRSCASSWAPTGGASGGTATRTAIMAEPHPDRPASDTDSDPVRADQVSEDLAALTELAAAGVEIDGEVQVAESIWVIYGHTSYDGEIIVGEYHDAAEATEVLRAAPRPHPDDDRPVP